VARSGARGDTTLDVIVPPPPAGAVAFVDAQHGWAGGAGGLLGMSDGRAFRVETRAPIIGISAFDRARAWALTGDGFVLRTSNGRNWSRLGGPHLFRVQFVDARIGFGLTRDGVLVRSGDAGLTWPQARSPGLVQSECFATRHDGWVARGGSVWTTHDGGARWTKVRLRSGPQEIPELGCRAGDAWVIFHEGVAAGTEGYHVFRSIAGGAWRAVLASPFQRRLPALSNYAGPFDVLGGGVAILSGSCAPCGGFGTGTIVRTLDGGRSFARATPFHGYTPRALSFVDRRRGWILTGGHAGAASAVNTGVVWSTTDGGRHWRMLLRSPSLGS
jgi:photosystem II stability/assembly factor-like uncharacterized protein